MGEIGVAVVVPRDRGARRRRSTDLRDFAATARRGVQAPRGACTSSTRSRSPRARRSTGARWPTSVAEHAAPVDSRDRRPHGARVHRRPGRAARRDPRGARRGEPGHARARGRRDRRAARPRCGSTMVELGWPALDGPRGATAASGSAWSRLAILAEELGRVDRARSAARRPSRSSSRSCASAAPPSSARASSARSPPARLAGLARDRRGRAGRSIPADVDRDRRRSTATTSCSRGEKRFVIEGDAVDELVVVARDRRHRPATTASARVRRPGRAPSTVTPVDRVRRQPAARARPPRRRARCQRDRVLGDPARRSPRALRRAVEEATVRARARDGRHRADDLRRHARLRQAARAVRRADRLVPGDQAQVRRHADRARAGPRDSATSPRSRSPRTTSAAHRATSVAKAAAGDCQRLLAKEGIQIHGGIGYTWEHDMHLYVKRVKSGEPLFGTSATHRAAHRRPHSASDARRRPLSAQDDLGEEVEERRSARSRCTSRSCASRRSR